VAFLEFTPKQTLYHYTSVDGLIGILRSKSLWLTDLYNTNDPREIHLGFEHFLSALSQVRLSEYPGPQGLFLDRMILTLNEYKKNTRSYCACFSLAADELPMWAAYGSNYGGVAIGFRPTAITSMIGRLQKVVYSDDDTALTLRNIASTIASEYKNCYNLSAIGEIQSTSASYAAMTSLKHQSWSYEREVRLVYAQSDRPGELRNHPVFSITSLLPNGKAHRWREPKIRQSNGIACEYMSLPFGSFVGDIYDPSRAIEKIIIGPKCTYNHEQLKTRMDEETFKDYTITISDCVVR
jgi:hypothetical protein